MSGSASLIEALEKNIGEILLGKRDPVRLALVALLAGGHVLIEDAPGVGKTVLGKALARSLDSPFRRLQFTPDLLPSDILGSSVYLPNKGDFEFRPGPIFTSVLLADEINRTTPRTQSALLEAMSEGQVSVDGQTYKLPEPFFVIATQNPFEFEGTYPLPENQLDRFTLCMEVGYPSREAEKQALVLHRQGEPVDHLKPVVSAQQLQELQRQVREVKVSDAINDYVMDIVEATRQHDQLSLGLSTRGALTLYRAVQSQAFVEGRDYATPDDVKKMVPCVVAHRVLCRGSVRLGQRTRARAILDTILQKTRVPS
ncbi:MAG: AAA family ATPase [Planctomycetaceae bacterium]